MEGILKCKETTKKENEKYLEIEEKLLHIKSNKIINRNLALMIAC
jgi:hypothetical protein